MALTRAHSFSRSWLAALADEIEWPTETERDLQRSLLASLGIGDVYLAVVAWVDGVKQYCQINFRKHGKSEECNRSCASLSLTLF
eukprot:CAMPEP_0172646722 /NCGR_PEP_ID=MMETSP1068-20121228/240386_1 /TAXON_ID=35684 /ORGANISM="Pseudopedinella elastica, Strain CCMP716" /LENGTH=84 /DNA_ID=CAMNT_0013460987 /DNA_START=54 /DNA_END=308 /DNA_ORIENTATION=+